MLDKIKGEIKDQVEDAIDSIENNERTPNTQNGLNDVTEELLEDPDATIELPMITPSRNSSRARNRPELNLHYDAERRFDENQMLDGMQPTSRLMIAKKVRVDRKNKEFSEDKRSQKKSQMMGIVRKYVKDNIIRVDGTATGSDFYPHNYTSGGVSLNNFDQVYTHSKVRDAGSNERLNLDSIINDETPHKFSMAKIQNSNQKFPAH